MDDNSRDSVPDRMPSPAHQNETREGPPSPPSPARRSASPARQSASPAKSDSSSASEKSSGKKRKKSESRSSSRSSSSPSASPHKSDASGRSSRSKSSDNEEPEKGRSRSRSVDSGASPKARRSSSDEKRSPTPDKSKSKSKSPRSGTAEDKSGSDSGGDVMSIPLPTSQGKSPAGSKTGTPARSMPSRQNSVRRSPSPRPKSKSRSASRSPDTRKRSRTPRRYRCEPCYSFHLKTCVIDCLRYCFLFHDTSVNDRKTGTLAQFSFNLPSFLEFLQVGPGFPKKRTFVNIWKHFYGPDALPTAQPAVLDIDRPHLLAVFKVNLIAGCTLTSSFSILRENLCGTETVQVTLLRRTLASSA